MSKGKRLNDFEIGQIVAYKKLNWSNRQIAKVLNRSSKVVNNYVKDPKNYGQKNPGGRPKSYTEREKRKIIRTASNAQMTARQIKAATGVTTHLRVVQNILHDSSVLVHKKIKRKPMLKIEHKNVRLDFARNHMSWTAEWKKTIFSDEKKFNLDGPDGFDYYWHDIRKEEKILGRRQMGGGSVMVWAAIGYKQNSNLEFINSHLDGRGYRDMLAKQFPTKGRQMAGNNWIFQQDNASIHNAQLVREWFAGKKITVMVWPALSPDLNPIENVWGWLARTVYENGRQFNNKAELREAIQKAWKELDQTKVQDLIDKMPNRMFDVIRNCGSWTKY